MRGKLLIISMDIPVFHHGRHFEIKIYLTKGEAKNFGAFINPNFWIFIKKYAETLRAKYGYIRVSEAAQM